MAEASLLRICQDEGVPVCKAHGTPMRIYSARYIREGTARIVWYCDECSHDKEAARGIARRLGDERVPVHPVPFDAGRTWR